MAQSASKILIDSSGPTDPSQIVAGTINTTLGTFGASTIHYQKVGNLYFNIWFSTGGGLSVFFSDSGATVTQLLVIFGLTASVSYGASTYGGYMADYNTAVWAGTPPSNNTRTIITAFLSN